jgi:hypothetical protein
MLFETPLSQHARAPPPPSDKRRCRKIQRGRTTPVIVIIMQRLHEDDLVGYILGQEQWEILSFPAIAEKDEEHRIETMNRTGFHDLGTAMLRTSSGRGLASRPRAA